MALYYASQLACGDFLVHVISSIPYLRLDIWSKTLYWTNFNAHEHRSLICLWFSSLFLSYFCLHRVSYTHMCCCRTIHFYQHSWCCCCCLLLLVWCMMAWRAWHTSCSIQTNWQSYRDGQWVNYRYFFFRSVRQKFTCIVGKSITVDFNFQTELLFSLCV